jgi:hypothetical protein
LRLFDLVAAQRPEEAARLPLAVAAALAAAQQGLDRRDAVAEKQLLLAPSFVPAVRVEGARHGYLAGLIADGIEIFPLAASQLWEDVAEARYARTLGIVSRDANRKVEPSEGASRLTGFRAKLPNQRAQIAYLLGSEGRVTARRAEGRPDAPPLLFLAAPISVIDHVWLGGLCHVRSIPVAGVFPG